MSKKLTLTVLFGFGSGALFYFNISQVSSPAAYIYGVTFGALVFGYWFPNWKQAIESKTEATPAVKE